MKKKTKNLVKVFYKPESHYYAGTAFILYHGFNEVEKEVLEEMKNVPAFKNRVEKGDIEIHDEIKIVKDVKHIDPVELVEDEVEAVEEIDSNEFLNDFAEHSAGKQKEIVEDTDDVELLGEMLDATEFKTVIDAIEKKLGE